MGNTGGAGRNSQNPVTGGSVCFGTRLCLRACLGTRLSILLCILARLSLRRSKTLNLRFINDA